MLSRDGMIIYGYDAVLRYSDTGVDGIFIIVSMHCVLQYTRYVYHDHINQVHQHDIHTYCYILGINF